MNSPRFGGPWTQDKLRILHAYLDAYTTALKNRGFTLVYVDAFAGAGSYVESGDDYAEFHEFRQGSARIALAVDDRPFDRLVFIEKDTNSAEALLVLTNDYRGRDIQVIPGDANIRVPQFCGNMGDFERAVVFLDPYATEVAWSTVEAIAATKKIDCWILFPLSAVARLMPLDREPSPGWAGRLDRIFGGRDYWQRSYRPSHQLSLLGDEPKQEREPIHQIVSLYRERLEGVFYRAAPSSRTLRNSKGSPLFELFFAASNPRGAPIAIDIADHILKNW